MDKFLESHLNQLVNSKVPNIFWDTLKYKLENEVFDAGKSFMIQKIIESNEESDDEISNKYDDDDSVNCKNDSANNEIIKWRAVVNIESGIDCHDINQIYLIDHAWTYRPEDARKYLTESDRLLHRMFSLMFPHLKFEENINHASHMVLRDMWKFNQTYSIGNENLGSESAVPIWYIMDELGCAIVHSKDPNVRIAPFCYVPTMTSYSIMWPIRNLDFNESLFRDYLNGDNDSVTQNIKLIPWFEPDLDEISAFSKIDYFSIFNDKFLVHTSLPMEVNPHQFEGKQVRIYSNVDQVVANLTDSNFIFVSSINDADIIWMNKSISDFKSFSVESPNKYINEFPFEMLITVKNMLALISRRWYSKTEKLFDNDLELEEFENTNDVNFPWKSPIWLPTTFDLNHELQLFVFYFYEREKRNLENYWIIKPYNLARSLDSHITNNLIEIIRLIETGPKIACKYISKPVLLYREDINSDVKFDLRFVVMLRSIKPLQVYVYEKFIVRVANKKFEMNNFDEYEQHFTVMNYKKNVEMKQISCEEFVELFNNQYPDHQWHQMLAKIRKMLRKIFEVACMFEPPLGIGVSNQSRAIYGADVMLRWIGSEHEPVILEMNYGPDNTRLYKRYSNFCNQIFNFLFRNQHYEDIQELLF